MDAGQTVYVTLRDDTTHEMEVVIVTGMYLHGRVKDTKGTFNHFIYPWENIHNVGWSAKS